MTLPIIETARLVLRAHTLDDFEPLAAMWGDAAVARYIGGKPATREESWVRLLRYCGHWQLMGFGYWAVALKGGAGYIGDVGFGRHAGSRLGFLAAGAWARHRHRGRAGRACLGRRALWQQDHLLHHQAGERGVHPGCAEVRVQRVHAHGIQGLAHHPVPQAGAGPVAGGHRLRQRPCHAALQQQAVQGSARWRQPRIRRCVRSAPPYQRSAATSPRCRHPPAPVRGSERNGAR